MRDWILKGLSRRTLLSGTALAAAGASLIGFARTQPVAAQPGHGGHHAHAGASDHPHTHANMAVGDVDVAKNGFDPSKVLTDWDIGTVTQLPDGRTLRTYEIVAEDRRSRSSLASSFRPGPTTGASPALPCAPQRASAYASSSGTRVRIPTRCISTASIPRVWTACPAPAK